MDPSKIKLPSFVFRLINSNYFYSVFAAAFIANVVYFIYQQQLNETSLEDLCLLYSLLIMAVVIQQSRQPLLIGNRNPKAGKILFDKYQIFPVSVLNFDAIRKLNRFKRIIIVLSAAYFQLVIGLLLGLFSLIYYNSVTENVFRLNFIILLINLNPFVKLEGYRILAEIIAINDLDERSNKNFINTIRFKKSDKSPAVQVYTWLKVAFYCWTAYNMGCFISQRYDFFMANGKMELIDSFSMFVVLYLLRNGMQNLKRNSLKAIKARE